MNLGAPLFARVAPTAPFPPSPQPPAQLVQPVPSWVPPPTPLACPASRGVFLLVVHHPAPCALQEHTLLLVLPTVLLVPLAHLPLQITLHHVSCVRAVLTATLLPSPLPSAVAMAQPPLATLSLPVPPPPTTLLYAESAPFALGARLLYSSPAPLPQPALSLG